MQPDHQLWTYLWESLPSTLPPPKAIRATQRYVVRKSTSSTLRCAEWISGVVLGMWDNVAGPRIEHVWMGVGAGADDHPELLHDITRDTLAGTLETKLLSKFVVLPHIGTVVSSVVFEAPSKDGPVKYTLALWAKRVHTGRILAVYPVVEDKLMYLALFARALATKGVENVSEPLNMEVDRAVMAMDSVFSVPQALLPGLPPTPDAVVNHGRTLYTAAKLFGLELLSRAVTSHLQTRGYTVVLGSDDTVVNTLVEALALFLDDRERKVSCRALCGRPYCADLVLQGVVPRGAVTQEHLIAAPVPTTVVDLGAVPRPAVYQPRSYPEYANVRRNYYRDVLSHVGATPSAPPTPVASPLPSPITTPRGANATLSSPPIGIVPQSAASPVGFGTPVGSPSAQIAGSPPNPAWLPKEGLLVVLQKPAPLVTEMLVCALKLPEPLRMSYIGHSCKRMAAKAVTLLKLLTLFIKQQSTLSEGTWKWLKENLGLAEDTDLNVLMAYADKLSPGLCQSISTDRLSLEEKFIELFDGFV
eukprot:m51a1_g5535 hypothetical protein (530) ;mRNA; f:459115-461251